MYPKYYIKENNEYILDYGREGVQNYTMNAANAFVMVDRKNGKIMTAVGVTDGKARYIKAKDIKCDDGREFEGAGLQVDYRNLGFKEDKNDPYKKDINQIAYFAFSCKIVAKKFG